MPKSHNWGPTVASRFIEDLPQVEMYNRGVYKYAPKNHFPASAQAFLALQTYHKNYIVVQPTIFNDAPLPLMDAIVVGVPPLSEPISSVTL